MTTEDYRKRHSAQKAREIFVKNIPANLRVELMIEALDIDKLASMDDARLLRIPGVGEARMVQLRTLIEMYKRNIEEWVS